MGGCLLQFHHVRDGSRLVPAIGDHDRTITGNDEATDARAVSVHAAGEPNAFGLVLGEIHGLIVPSTKRAGGQHDGCSSR